MANIIVSPGKYIQGSGELENLYAHLKCFGKRFFIIGTSSGLKRVQPIIEQSFSGKDAKLTFEVFGGECCKTEIERLVKVMRDAGASTVVGVGGGKTLDTAKAVAYYEKLPVAIIPTIASTDAPCSALAVLYTEKGVFEKYLFLPKNPDLVLVDTEIIAAAPTRLLVAGMGDALATYFEARACAASNATNCAGGKCTKAALALARLCYDTLIEDGVKALFAMENHVCTKAVENIIEANTYLSGIGFESAGLAGAHAIHNGLTAIRETHKMYHGEKVAFGAIVQLVLEDAPMEELGEVLDFCMSVGLPTTLKDLGIERIDAKKLMEAAALACAENDTLQNMPFPVTPKRVYSALLTADAMGKAYAHECNCE